MTPDRRFLYEILENSLAGTSTSFDFLDELGAKEIANLLATSYFLTAVTDGLKDHHWILTRGKSEQQPVFQNFLSRALREELAPFQFLSPLLSEIEPSHLDGIAATLKALTAKISSDVLNAKSDDYRDILKATVRSMGAYCTFEENLARTEHFLAPSLYQAFDALDELFVLQFGGDDGMKAHANERLYEGAGRGVQTSYAQIFSVLDHLRLREGAHLVDLGSGFGRMGLVAGLWRDDLRFTGYEYVSHRVSAARISAERAGLAGRVEFFQQDLSADDFEIPSADVYYMYDPFTAETYEKVIARLLDVGRARPVSVVTKGNAGASFEKAAPAGEWHAPEKFDGGILWIFRSRGN